MNTAADNKLIDEAFAGLREAYLASNHRKKTAIIDHAFEYARRAHAGARRLSGEPYIMHSIAVARICLDELGLGSTSISAALLHDVVSTTEYTIEDIRTSFGNKMASLVEGISKISGGIFGDKALSQADKFRKLLLSMNTDIRVVLIKMADRLHNMRTLEAHRPEKQLKIANETLHVYAPLAERLGLYRMKSELENLAFRFCYPEEYNDIISRVKASELDRQAIVDEFVRPVSKKLDAAGFRYEIKARVKSAFSIHNKMKKKNVPFEEIFDIYAVRVIFENDDDEFENSRCWEIHSFFADEYKTHPNRLRDWTAIPKSNGYRALHLTCMGPDGRWIEVQIRSRKMDDIAELGYASHWRYKTGDNDFRAAFDNSMNSIKDILADPDPEGIDSLENIKLSSFAQEIFVLTPRGDLITLPSGATVLDMAFAIHSELGLHCVAGKINHRLFPPSHVLGSGDRVEIITSRTRQPQADWVNFCKTQKAINALRPYMKADSCRLVLASFTITGTDRRGILEAVVKLFSVMFRINMRRMSVTTIEPDFNCTLEADLDSMEQAQSICSELLRIPGITEATATRLRNVAPTSLEEKL